MLPALVLNHDRGQGSAPLHLQFTRCTMQVGANEVPYQVAQSLAFW